MGKTVSLINGPNLNLLGKRDEGHYGKKTLDEIVSDLAVEAKALGLKFLSFQSNSEGEIVGAIQQAVDNVAAIIINPGAYTHTSIAIRDALECFRGDIVEVHLSNIYAREEFRRNSYISEVATGVISGFGPSGYSMALSVVADDG